MMQYRRFGRTEFCCFPAAVCANIRIQVAMSRWLIPRIIRITSYYPSELWSWHQPLRSCPWLWNLWDTGWTDSAHFKARSADCPRPSQPQRKSQRVSPQVWTIRTNLRLDYVDLLRLRNQQCWNIAPQYPIRWLSGSRTEAASARQIRFIGFSTHGPTDIVQTSQLTSLITLTCTGTIIN